MGLDTSSHPFDITLLQTRIIPFILNDAPIDDLIEQAAALQMASHRINAWGLMIQDCSSNVFRTQLDLLPEPQTHQKTPGFLSRLFGRGKPLASVTSERPTGLPGFDSDLLIWGRPFFTDGDTPADVVNRVDAWLGAIAEGGDAFEMN